MTSSPGLNAFSMVPSGEVLVTLPLGVVGENCPLVSPPALATALRPCGVLFYQTFSQTRITGVGPSNPAFRLADNELLRLLPQLRLRFYREEASLGDLGVGCRDLAMLVGERPR